MEPKQLSISEINTQANWLQFTRIDRDLDTVLVRMFRLLQDVQADPGAIEKLQDKYALMSSQLQALYSQAIGEDR